MALSLSRTNRLPVVAGGEGVDLVGNLEYNKANGTETVLTRS